MASARAGAGCLSALYAGGTGTDRGRPTCQGPARSELLCGASSGQVGNRGSPGLGSPHRSHKERLALLTPEGLEEMPRQAQGPVEP